MNRTQALMKALGWQGGTIHQVAAETGCDATELLYAVPAETYLNSDYCKGWFAARTCSREFNLARNFPMNKGRIDFWLGVAEGLMIDA